MKTAILLVLMTGLLHGAVDEARLLRSIAMVEGGSRTGAHGEIGPYQMRSEAVKYAGGHDYAAALKWLHHLKTVLQTRGVDWNVFDASLTWNAGLTNVLQGRAPLGSYDYATRTSNIYSSYARQ